MLGGAVLTQTASHLDAEATGGTSQVPQPTCSWTSRYRGRGREQLWKYTIRIVSQSPVRVNQSHFLLTLVSLPLDNAPYHIIWMP